MKKRCMVMIEAFVFALALSARAAGPDTVADVRFENIGPGPLDEAFVELQISVKKGALFSQVEASKDVRALLTTERFSYVDVGTEESPTGLVVVYKLRNKLKLLEPLRIQGAQYFRESRIRRMAELDVGARVDEQALAMAAGRICEEYRDRNFPDVKVTWTVVATQGREDWATVTLEVKEGTRQRIDDVIFEGNTRFSTRELRPIVTEKHWYNPFSWFKRKRYDSTDLDTARTEVREFYVSRGYLDAQVAMPEWVQIEPDGPCVKIAITEGPLYRFGRATLGGITLFPESELRSRISFKSGEVALPAMLEKNVQSLRDYYGSRGYIHATVHPVLDPGVDQETVTAEGVHERVVDVHFRFTEAYLVHINNINIQGNTRTKDKVIRRELLAYPGEIFDEVKVRSSKNRLMNLGYFQDVRYMPVGTRDEGFENLIFEVEEKQTGQFWAGLGYSSVDSVFGYAGISQQNFDLFGWPYFTGDGQKIRISAQIGSDSESYELNFVEPWFLDRKLELGFSLFKRTSDYSEYSVDRTGGGVTLGKSLPLNNRVDLGYQFEKVTLSDATDTNEYRYVDDPDRSFFFKNEERDAYESSVTLTLTHDRRDNPFVPTRGLKASLAGTLTGGPLGFDTDVYSVAFKAQHYIPLWFGHVFNTRLRADVVEAYGNTDEVPIFDRLFIGGGRTLRGYDYRDVGPKVFRTYEDETGSIVYHKPVGGETLGLLGFEYTLPIVPKILRFGMFYDIGNVWSDAYEFDFHTLASSVGCGLRVDIPGFPIRIDRAWTVKKDDEMTDIDTWVFYVGPSF